MKRETTSEQRRKFLDELVKSHSVPEVFEAWKTGQIRMESALLCTLSLQLTEVNENLIYLLNELQKKI